MNTAPMKSVLAPAARRLVEEMQRINFGRVEKLAFRDGLPVFDPAPRVVLDIKLGNDNGGRRERDLPDFELKAEVVDLFRHMAALGDGLVESLEIRGGLPCRMQVEALRR